MKIAFIGQKGVPATQGGVEKHVQELALRLYRAGHDVLVYARPAYVAKSSGSYFLVNGKLQKRGQGPKVIVLPSLVSKYFDTITHTFISILHATWADAEIMHFQGDGPSLLIWLPKLLWPKVKVVATFHSIDRLHQKWGFLARQFLHLGEWLLCLVADEVICVGETLQKYVAKTYHRETFLIPNGVAVIKVSKRECQKILRGFNLTEGKYILMVSRLVRHKGAHYLVEAFKKLGKRAVGLELVIVGEGAFTDSYVQELQEMARGNSHIHLVGLQTSKKLAALYRGARVTVQPSESEGLSLVVLEAIAQSPRVLVSDISENLELTKDRPVPAWLELDAAGMKAKVLRLPEKEDIPAMIQEQLIVELYSK